MVQRAPDKREHARLKNLLMIEEEKLKELLRHS